jgi:ubiquitin carboxyl-terminal hydrolase 7
VWGCSQLEDGDIICFQRAQTPHPHPRFPTVHEFLEYVKHKQEVKFRKLDAPKDEGLTLELSKLMTYNEVCERLAAELQVADAQLLRLTAHNVFSGNPVRCPPTHFLSPPCQTNPDRPIRNSIWSFPMLTICVVGRGGAQKPNPFKSNAIDRLSELLTNNQHTSDILYYEVLDLPLAQVEQLKIMKVRVP